MNYYNGNIIYVPGCLICPHFQADSSPSKVEWSFEINQLLTKKNIEISQMPCPEFTFFNDLDISSRKTHGLVYYYNLPGFDKLCEVLSDSVVEDILSKKSAGYNILAILGVEHSPTCAVNYMYTNNGTIHQKGIFFEKINCKLSNLGINIVQIGINRRFYKKAISKINNLLTYEKRD